jgi:ATP-binding cassette subfamily B protein
MLYLHWKLGLVALSVVPLCWLSTVRAGRKIHEVARSQRMREGAVASTAAESITAIKTVQALSLESKFADLFHSHNVKSQKEEVRGKKLEAGLQRRVDVIMALATALVLWYGSLEVFHHRLSPGDILVFLAYLKNAMRPIQDLGKYTGRLAKATAAGDRIIDVLDSVSEVRDLPGAVTAPAFTGAVQFEHVSYAYEPGHPALRNLNVNVTPGQRVALAGPSGGGKSTFLGMILRFHDPTEGRVMIDGRDVREYKLASLRPQISVVLQDTLLFATSVWDNIGCAATEATREQIIAAARLANAHEFILELPQGYDTVLGERGVTLSGGQRQRIAIARAAIRQAPILILDEPMAGLDEENERAVIEAFERVSAGCTTFLVSHDLQHAVRADCIIYLEDGRVLEQGTHSELMAANGRYARMYRMQATLGNSQDAPKNSAPLRSTTAT